MIDFVVRLSKAVKGVDKYTLARLLRAGRTCGRLVDNGSISMTSESNK